METGECVCIKDVLANWLKSETTISEILNDMKTLIGEENFEKFITHPAPHLDADNRRCMEMAKKVGEKLLKVLASEFAYLNFPDGDTNKLTNVVRVLISSDTFEPILKSHFFTNLSERDSYTAVLALVLYACGMGVAQQLVLPVFEQTWDIQSYSVHLPSLVAALCPGESTSNLKHEEKIEKICNVLEERGITIKRKTERQERPGSTGTFTVSVFHDGELKHHHECECLGDYFSIVMEEAKKILAADKKKVQNSPQVVLAPSDLRMWMHNVHAILRLHEPYRDHIGENMLDSIIQSNGWIPLSFVNEMLAIASKKKMHALPQRHEWLVQLLNKHDNFGRFQVGVCSMEDSRFKGEECARSFYGHDVSQNLAASIFREFKTVEGQGDVCHVFGWVNVHKQQLEAMKRQEPLKLYNKMQCLYVFSGNTVNEFQEYRVRTPVPEQYDEKLGRRSDLIFLEFCLRAAVRDEKIDVFEVPRKAGGCHWVLFSKYTIEDGIETCIPSYYFTGKVRILKFAGCTTPQTDETEGKVFTEVEVQDEKWSDLTRNPSAPLELTLQWLVDIPHTYSPEELSRIFGTDRPDAEAHDNVDITGDEEKLRQTLHPSERVAFLDTSEYKQKVLKFCSNADESLILLHIPKHNENGFSFCNRSKNIAEFKRWVCDHGLKCQKIRSTDESGVVETYEIRKCGIWNERIVDVVAKELGLSDIRQSDLLRQAMTRECDNKDANYEILEFIGDAVMDFLVVFDSFILGSPWNVNVVSAVCQNRILAHLLPTGLAERLDYLYRDVNMKVKADIVEGIIGAVYRSGVGLDRVRSLLCRFFASLPQRVSGCGNEYLSPKLLEEAIKICPYLQKNSDTLHERHKYNCKFFINDDAAARYKKMSSTPFKCKTTSHYASTPFNRIQQKLHATHFTTGVQYSYRRIASIDTPAIFNRILSAFAANSMAFVNEVFTDNTHVVIDFDGASIKAHGALGLFSRWFRERFSSKSAMFVLTSSGKSIVTKNDKLSYHIHFPQAVVSLEELKSMMDDLTNHIVKHLGLESFAGNIVGYQVPCGNQVVEEANRPTICGRVVLCPRYLRKRLSLVGMTAERKFTVLTGLRDMIAVGATCKKMYAAVLSHLCSVMCCVDDLASLAGVEENKVFRSDASEKSSVEEFVIMRVIWGSKCMESILTNLVIVPAAHIVRIDDSQCEVLKSVNQTVDGKTFTQKEFFNEVILPAAQKSVFSSPFWKQVIDSGLPESRKLRMYLNDKYDMIYGQELRPLFAHELCFADCKMQAVAPESTGIEASTPFGRRSKNVEQSEEEYKVEIAHASALRLTSVRCPEYRDTSGLRRFAWASDFSKRGTAHLDMRIIPAQKDRLPPFNKFTKEDKVPATEWYTWTSGVCSLPEVADSCKETKKECRTAALQLAYWTFDAEGQRACFWIGGEVVLFVSPCNSLLDGLERMKGMEKMAQFLVPSVDVEGLDFSPEWVTSYSANVFPLFCPLTKKAATTKKKTKTGQKALEECVSSEPREVVAAPLVQVATVNTTATIVRTSNSSVQLLNTSKSSKRHVQCTVVSELLPCTESEDIINMNFILMLLSSCLLGSQSPSLFITSDEIVFSALARRFPHVVSPGYFSTSPLERFAVRVNRTFGRVFIIDSAVEPYSDKVVRTNILKCLTSQPKLVFVPTKDIQKIFVSP